MNGGHNIHSLTFGSGPKSGTGSPSPRPTGLHRHVSAAFQALAIGCREEAAVSGLIRGLEENGDLRVSLSSLSRGDRHKILSYVGEAHFAELSALAAEADAELFFEQLLNFWLRLDGEAQAEAQIAGLSLLAEASEGRMPAWIREKARREREARMGLGLGPDDGPRETAVPPGVHPEDGIDEDEAVAWALWNNAAFQEAIATLGYQRADLVQAGLLPNPVFSVLFPLGPKQLEFA
ncbi:hypothetical protein F9K50_05280, partial [bacterium]